MNVQGNYTVRFDAQTQEGERIYCLTAEFYLTGREGREDARNRRIGQTKKGHEADRGGISHQMLGNDGVGGVANGNAAMAVAE
jgi:hypothetical protein